MIVDVPAAQLKAKEKEVCGECSPDTVFSLPEEQPEELSLPHAKAPLAVTSYLEARAAGRLVYCALLIWAVSLAMALSNVMMSSFVLLAEAHIPAGARIPMTAVQPTPPPAQFDYEPTEDDCYDSCIETLPRQPIGRMRCLSVCGVIEPGFLASYPPMF